MKLSKRIKSTLFIIFFLKYVIRVSSLSANEHIQKYFARGFGACINNIYIFQIYDFSRKNFYFGGNIYM